MDEARRVAEQQAEFAARNHYGKLLAILASRSGDIAAAEDGLADAFAAALAQWPDRGIPANPAAWLLTVARRSIGHRRARSDTALRAIEAIRLLNDERQGAEPDAFGDHRLKLLFVCAHPAISVDVQAPLMLQTVLGLDAARIASCFLVSPRAMGQKLVRAKTKIRDAGIAFAVPDASALEARTDAVLSAIYAAFGSGWEDVAGADPKLSGLAEEAIWLGRLMLTLRPDDAEAKGLMALMLHCEARRAARRDAEGHFVPLRLQDMERWSSAMIAEAEGHLHAAAALRAPGRFQTEAAIQSLHWHQRVSGRHFGPQLVRLYDVLTSQWPSTGALVAGAVAQAENGDSAEALRILDTLGAPRDYQPWWAARARILWLTGERDAADAAARIAAGLSRDKAVQHFLLSGGYRFGAQEPSPPQENYPIR